MFIVLEGADGTGKSTLAKDINRVIGGGRAVIRHFGPPTTHALAEYGKPLGGVKADPYRNRIFDRYHWGEYVYGPLFRGRTELGIPGMIAINEAIYDLGGVIVWVHAPPEVREQRLSKRDDRTEYEEADMQSRIDARFGAAYGLSRNNGRAKERTIRIDTSTTCRETAARIVLHAAADAMLKVSHADAS